MEMDRNGTDYLGQPLDQEKVNPLAWKGAEVLPSVQGIELVTTAAVLRAMRAPRDDLTDLPLRGLLNARLELLVQTQPGAFIMLFVDLNDVKDQNTEGYAAGDRALLAAADSLRDADGMAVRVGGDEFAVLITKNDPSVTSYESNERVVGRALTEENMDSIIERLRNKFRENGVSAAIGGALHRPGESIGELKGRADQDMKLDKLRHRIEQYHGHDAEVQALALHALEVVRRRRRIGKAVTIRSIANMVEALDATLSEEAPLDLAAVSELLQ